MHLWIIYLQAGTIATTDNVIAAQTKTPSHPFMSIKTKNICHSSATLIRYGAFTGADATLFLVAQRLTGHCRIFNCFIDVETSCSGDSLLIMASLQEPFFGLIYANGFATSPSCRAEGTGNRLLRLALNASECGIHFIQTEV